MRKHRSGWHPEDIKAAIRKRGQTLTGLAKAHGLPPANVRNATRSPVRSGEVVIARFLDVPLHELWPDRWDALGNRLLRSRKPKCEVECIQVQC